MRVKIVLSLVVIGLTGLGGAGSLPSFVTALHFESAEAQPPSSGTSFPPGQMPTAATWQQFLESVRQGALAYTAGLPNFICTQYVKRMTKLGNTNDWKLWDQIVVEITNNESGEHHRPLLINGKPASLGADIQTISGFSSVGDFGNALYLVFAPESNASFRMEGSARIAKRKTVRIGFSVPQENSRYYTAWEDRNVATAYRGHCWIDLASQQVVRLESEAVGIPRALPMMVSSHSTDYDLIEIFGNKYRLPVRASAELKVVNEQYRAPVSLSGGNHVRTSENGSGTMEVRNVIEYKEYRKFGTEVRLAPE